MKTITFYILLICAVTVVNSARHEKKVMKKKLQKLTHENLEEEARRDIEKLLKGSKTYADVDDDDYEYRDAVPTHIYSSSKTRTQNNQNKWLVDRIVKLINKLDKTIQRKNTNRGSDRKTPWFDRPHSIMKKKPALRNQYHQLMKKLAANHGQAVKERVNQKIHEDERSFKARGSRFEQLMNSIAMKHRLTVKERYTDIHGNLDNPLRQGPDNKKPLRDLGPYKMALQGARDITVYAMPRGLDKEDYQTPEPPPNNAGHYLLPLQPDNDLEHIQNAVEHVNNVENNQNPIEPANNVENNQSPIEPANNVENNQLPIEPANNLGNNQIPMKPDNNLENYQNEIEPVETLDQYHIPERPPNELENYQNAIGPASELYNIPILNNEENYQLPTHNAKVMNHNSKHHAKDLGNYQNPRNYAIDMDMDHNPPILPKDLENYQQPIHHTDSENYQQPIHHTDSENYQHPVHLEDIENYQRPVYHANDMENYQLPIYYTQDLDHFEIPLHPSHPAHSSKDTKQHLDKTTENPMDNDLDVNFADLLAGRYLRQLKKWGETKFPKGADINLVMRNGNLYLDKSRSKRSKYWMTSRMRSNKPRRYENRFRRSPSTQAGYTQDPDTCKTYNDNLMKLWANLSKLINITEQPNERALHNIAIMIQAYLDHQNAKPTTESYKVKPEPPRDKVGEVILKVKKILDDEEINSERVSRTIIKNLKPFYGEAENSDCQTVNEESLNSSIDLLYRNYLENVECRNEDDGSALNLRKRGGKNIQTHSGKWQTTSDADKPDINSIIVEDELYKEINKGQVPRQRPPSKFRRIFKRSKITKSPFLSRSTGQSLKGSDKSKIRTKSHSKTIAKKLRKSLLKTDVDKGKCEKYAIRKFTMGLRPVIDRFMSLLECQLDNTLRSLNYDKVLANPYYLYGSKFQSKENIDTQEHKLSLRQMAFTRKKLAQAHVLRKSQAHNRYDLSNENDNNSLYEQNDEASYDKQISAEKVKPSYVSDVLDSFKVSATEDNMDDNKEDDQKDGLRTKNDDDDTTTRPEIKHVSFKSEVKAAQIYHNTHKEKKVDAPSKDKDEKQTEISFNMIYENTVPDTNIRDDSPLSTLVSKNKIAMTNGKGNSHEQQNVDGNTDNKSYENIKDFLRTARDDSLRTPEFAVPFDLSSNNGYVELTHLVKHPKIIVYRPQFIVKNTMPYDDFLKTIGSFNMTNDEVRLMKIVRHLPDNTVSVLFETEDFEPPLEVRNFRETRRWGLPLSVVNNLHVTRTVKKKQSDKPSDDDDDKDISINLEQANSNIGDDKIETDQPVIREKNIERQLINNLNSDNNHTLDSNSIAAAEPKHGIVLVPRTASGLLSKISSGITSGISSRLNSGLVSSISSTIESGIDSTKNLVSNLNPIQSIKSNSLLKKIFPSFLTSETSEPIPPLDSNLEPYYSPQLDYQLNPDYQIQPLESSSNFQSNSEPIENTSNLDLQSITPEPSYYKELWEKWKLMILNRLQKIIGTVTSLASNIDHIEST